MAMGWSAGGAAHGQGQRGVIYCLTKAETIKAKEQLLRVLQPYEISGLEAHVLLHHADMTEEQRRANVETFTQGAVSPVIVIATSCFGTGIDAKGVSFVVCIGGAYSVLDMHQALGRAGREGQPATCLVLWYAEHERLLRERDTPRNDAGVQDAATTASGTLAFFEAALQDKCLRQHLTFILDGTLGPTCIGMQCEECSSCEDLERAEPMVTSPPPTPIAEGQTSPVVFEAPQSLFQSQAGSEGGARESHGERQGLANSNSFFNTSLGMSFNTTQPGPLHHPKIAPAYLK